MKQPSLHIPSEQEQAEEQHWLAALDGPEHSAMEAYAAVFRKFEPLLIIYVRPFVADNLADAKEIVQTVFIKLWEKRKRMTGVRHLDRYLYRMTRNATWDYKENQYLERQRALQVAGRLAPQFDVADKTLEMRELDAEAVKALSLLPDRRRLIFLAYTREDLSLDQIADTMGVSKDVVKKQLHLATRFLKNYVAKKGGNDPGIAFLLFFF